MWVLREQGEISSFVNLDALDVTFHRGRRNFKVCVLGCARCGFSESKEKFLAL